MKKEKNLISVLLILSCLLIFSSCNQRPSPQEVAQFMLDIKNCNFDAVEKTIKKNKKILNIGFQGMYPIHMAIKTKNADMVRLIAKPNTVNILLKTNTDTWSPLSLSLMQQCNSEIIKILLENGANPNYIDEKRGCNIFHDFSASRNIDVWEILKEYATPENLNKEMGERGSTPLITLIGEQIEKDNINDPDVIYLLKSFIEHGGNPNYIIYYRDYAFEVVNFLNSYEVFEYKQVLLDGMKNSPPIEDSEILIEMLEGKTTQ
ncbi:MAG: ankyrin repeat domain-containing protein [Treponema sp.]|nr:ankyrin repeat domain-containing protein [Clostridia bacterium]MBP3606695.1 ankyrin repeat domain-containing protein [Treponema sp.]